MDNSDPQALLVTARNAAWSGDHSTAIDCCTAALHKQGLHPALRLDLLDTRAESYFAQVQLDQAEKDAIEMVDTAYETDNPALNAQALNRLAYIQMRQGRTEKAVETATTALAEAVASEQKELEAESLYRLGLVQGNIGLYHESIDLRKESG